MMIEEGREDFLILESQDGFFQFYGIDNQFVAEVRVNLPNGDFQTYSIIDKEKEQQMERIRLSTPYGEKVSEDLPEEGMYCRRRGRGYAAAPSGPDPGHGNCPGSSHDA